MAGAVLRAASTLARVLPRPARLALYRLRPLPDLLRSLLNRAAPTGVHPVRVAAGELAGMWLLLDLQVDKDLWLGPSRPPLAPRRPPAGGWRYPEGGRGERMALYPRSPSTSSAWMTSSSAGRIRRRRWSR